MKKPEMNVMEEIDANMAARRKLERIAEGGAVTLTSDEARRLVEMLRRDAEQIGRLTDALPDDG